ncbi:energy transducer TonB [bacterium]|nr:energy transducer TonB [bacterium]MBU1984729.1 energy transducer TonB [bacterium]
MNFFDQLTKDRYGSFELKWLVGPNLIKGFIASVLLHGIVAASPVIIELFKGGEEIPDRIFVIDPSQIQPRLRTKRGETVEQVQVARPKIAPPKAAIPIPVEEEQVPEEQELIPTQTEIASYFEDQAAEDGDLGIPEGYDIVIGDMAGDGDIPSSDIFIPFEVPPQPLPDFSPQPDFPELARQAGMPGKVTVHVYVDKHGDVKKWKILKADPAGLGFEEEVEKIIKKWKFTPAIQQGNPVGVWVAVPFNFKYKR